MTPPNRPPLLSGAAVAAAAAGAAAAGAAAVLPEEPKPRGHLPPDCRLVRKSVQHTHTHTHTHVNTCGPVQACIRSIHRLQSELYLSYVCVPCAVMGYVDAQQSL